MSLCRYAGCKPNNVWSGLENFRTHESVGELLVDAEDGTSKEAVTDARWLVLWAFSATSSLEGDWFTLAPYYFSKNAMCMETVYSYIATKGACKDSSCTVDIVQGSVTDTRTCPPKASKL